MFRWRSLVVNKTVETIFEGGRKLVIVEGSAFEDSFDQMDVHVYRLGMF
jgi:hypothetical protein